MKNLKSVILGAAIALISSSAILTSCQSDPCKDKICNQGTCDDGTCICPAGYEGTSCETETRVSYLGAYAATDLDTVSGSSTSYTGTISSSTGAINKINLAGFANGLYTAVPYATVSGNTVTIPSQDPDADGFLLSGSFQRTTSGSTTFLVGKYSVVDPSTNKTYTFKSTWAK